MQALTEHNKERVVLLYKELPEEEYFDHATAVKIWSRMAPRNLSITTKEQIPSTPSLHLVKPYADITAARNKKRTLLDVTSDMSELQSRDLNHPLLVNDPDYEDYEVAAFYEKGLVLIKEGGPPKQLFKMLRPPTFLLGRREYPNRENPVNQ